MTTARAATPRSNASRIEPGQQMPNNSAQRSTLDRRRVAGSDEYEVEYFAQKYGLLAGIKWKT